jgi:hypothetical protein
MSFNCSMSVTRSGSPLNYEKYIKAIVEELDEDATQIQTEFRLSTSTWDNPAVFIIKKSGEYERQIVTSDENYARLDKGTRIRRVVMTQDFIAKSQPGSLAARSGAGGVARFSKYPLPGIKARNFVKTLADGWQARFPANMRNAIDAAGV